MSTMKSSGSSAQVSFVSQALPSLLGQSLVPLPQVTTQLSHVGQRVIDPPPNSSAASSKRASKSVSKQQTLSPNQHPTKLRIECPQR
eukprot:2353232-Amphidinium_carterae.1